MTSVDMTRLSGAAPHRPASRPDPGESRGASFDAHLAEVADAPGRPARAAPDTPRRDTAPAPDAPGEAGRDRPRALPEDGAAASDPADRPDADLSPATPGAQATPWAERQAKGAPVRRAPDGARTAEPGRAALDGPRSPGALSPASASVGRDGALPSADPPARADRADGGTGPAAPDTRQSTRPSDEAGRPGAPTTGQAAAEGGAPLPRRAPLSRPDGAAGRAMDATAPEAGRPAAGDTPARDAAPAPPARPGTPDSPAQGHAEVAARHATPAAPGRQGPAAETHAPATGEGAQRPVPTAHTDPSGRGDARPPVPATNGTAGADIGPAIGPRPDAPPAPTRSEAPSSRAGALTTETGTAAPLQTGAGRAATPARGRPVGPDVPGAVGTPVTPGPAGARADALRLPPDAGSPRAPAAEAAGAVGTSPASSQPGGGPPSLPGAAAGIDTKAPGWASRVVQEVRLARESGAQEHELVLRPDRLGRVQIRFELTEGNVSVRILTETPEAARLFAEAQPRLADAFGRAGLDLAQHHSESATQTGGERQAGQGGSGRHGAPPGQAAGQAPEDEGAVTDHESASLHGPAASRRGGIDLTA